jgi:O-antigen/teichoic acid export membrane protein
LNTLILYIVAFKYLDFKINLTFNQLNWEYFSEILKFNFYNFLNTLNYVVFLQLPAVVVAKKFGVEYSGYYGIGLQINNLIRGSFNILLSAMSPVFNLINAQKDYLKLSKLYYLSSKIFVISGGLVIIVAYYFLNDFIFLWLGQRSSDLLIFLKVFTIFISIGIMFIPSALILITLEKLKSSVIVGLITSLLASIAIYLLPAEANQYFWVPLILSVLFAIYNLHRYFVSIGAFKIGFSEWNKIILIFISSGIIILIIHLISPLNYIFNGIISIVLFIGIIILFVEQNDVKTLLQLIKKQ